MKDKKYSLTRNFHPTKISSTAQYFLKDEAISGKLILIATFAALIAANSGFSNIYKDLWATDFQIQLGGWIFEKDLKHWVNDLLMAFFFMVVGLELKRELVKGELQKLNAAILPIAAAIGGMAVPALIYFSFNLDNPETIKGWVIPMATDIAFAVGALALVARRIPSSIRIFLLTLAIVDDIAAVTLIAVVYSSNISLGMLFLALLVALAISLLKKLRRLSLPMFILGAIILWLAVNASGVHASIAGALIGFLAPLALQKGQKKSIAERSENLIIPISTLIVIPIFAFANTGVKFGATNLDDKSTVPLAAGIIFGLAAGKVLGVVGASWLMVKLGLASLPYGARWSHLAGVGFLAGIGFTVSIFVTELAFEDLALIQVSKISIFVASAISAALGLLILRFGIPGRRLSK